MRTRSLYTFKTIALAGTFSIFAIVAAIGQTTAGLKPAQNILANGSKPAVFLQDGVSVPNNESVPAFTSDGNTVYLADDNKISQSNKINGKWTKPQRMPFSGPWNDWDPALSPDGKRLVFVSNRKVPGVDTSHKNNHLWYSERLPGDHWSGPRHIESPINIDGVVAYAPCISNKGTICFCSRNREGHKGMSAYYARWAGDHYENPQLLALNGSNDVYDPYIAPDETYIIFSSNNSIYISYRQGNTWTPGEKLGSPVNDDAGWHGSPVVSPDGKMLYYSSEHVNGILMIPVHIPSPVRS